MKIVGEISTIGHIIGGALGHGIETGVDGYETYQNIHSHNYAAAVETGAETIINGAETIIDGLNGDWL